MRNPGRGSPAFCKRASTGSDKNVTGDDLAELKKR